MTKEDFLQSRQKFADSRRTNSTAETSVTMYWGEDGEYHMEKGKGYKKSYRKNGEKFMQSEKSWNKEEGWYTGSYKWDKDDGKGV